MLKLGIIGTSPISHHFIAAALETGAYEVAAVYSRSLEKAQEFAREYDNTVLFTDLTSFFQSTIDVVYIASPNSLHFSHAQEALRAKKHVILEKPAVSTPAELDILIETAATNSVFLFEAARNYHEVAFETIRDFLADKEVLGANFTYAKYSSKMGDLLAGKEPNIFSATYSGGALMDLGVYTLYAAISLFGQPEKASYSASQLPNSVDLHGSGLLFYPTFTVQIQAGKNITSNLPSEIYTTTGTLTLNDCQAIQSAVFNGHDGSSVILSLSPQNHNMFEEALAFATAIQTTDQASVNKWLADAKAVHQTLYTMRQDAAITFEADTYAPTISN